MTPKEYQYAYFANHDVVLSKAWVRLYRAPLPEKIKPLGESKNWCLEAPARRSLIDSRRLERLLAGSPILKVDIAQLEV